MNRETFLDQLRIRLSQLPEEEMQKRLDYYNEMIEDMIEDGISEEDAVESFGSVDEIAQKIMQEVPLAALMKTKVKPKKVGLRQRLPLLYSVRPCGFLWLLRLLRSLHRCMW